MEKLIKNLLVEKSKIIDKYSDLFDKNTPIVPIPFFGNIQTAKIITIGANPSSTELKNNEWSETMSSSQIKGKLVDYFNDNPHKWFDTYELALGKIGYSYFDGSAAHFDLCPWATMSLGLLDKDKKTDKVIELFKESINSFKNLIINHVKANHVLMTGTVTKNFYIDDFIVKHINEKNIELFNKQQIKMNSPFVNSYTLKISNYETKALFISISPSSRTEEQKEKLIELIEENINYLK